MLITLIVTIALFTVAWAAHIPKNDAGIIDLFWGPGFAVIALICFALGDDHTLLHIILLLSTIAWSLRLGWYLTLRHNKSANEDRRYAKMRTKNGPSFWWVSFFKIFLLQAVLMWLIATPQHLGLLYFDTPISSFENFLFFVGFLAFIFGFLFETIADWQLSQFKNQKKNHNQTMSKGLWAYSRHPNYFGEVMLWWGFGLMALALSGSPLALAGPALLTFLILKVSGVSMLEKHLAPEKENYRDYIKNTSSFFPRRPQ